MEAVNAGAGRAGDGADQQNQQPGADKIQLEADNYSYQGREKQQQAFNVWWLTVRESIYH